MYRNTRILRAAALGALAPALLLNGAQAASLAGQVTNGDGRPVAGAMVSVFAADGKRRETVYTAADGRYAIRTPFGGELKVRARAANLQDAQLTLALAADQTAAQDFRLERFADVEKASAALSASAHNARLSFASAADQHAFVSQCNYCHQVGNALTRVPRSHEAWVDTIERMEGYFAMLSAPQIDRVGRVLERGFDGKPVQAMHDYGATPELARAKVEEWLVGLPTSFIHDTDVGHDDKLYGTDEGHDKLWILDRKTNAIEEVPLPDIDLPEGGVFSGMQLPIGIFTGKHGPHSTAQAEDGSFYITNALSSTIMAFNPGTKAFKTYPVPGDALYPHTIRIDRQGIVWFTIVASNQVGRFDPRTEQMTVMRLPHNGLWRWVSDLLLPTILKVSSWMPKSNLLLDLSHHRFLGFKVLAFPYGIDIHPKDGSVWYAKLYANKIGRIDPATLQVTEYDTPMKGPRRPRFDASGALWIPSFDEGGLMRFDPAASSFESWKLPALADKEYEVPYALNVHPKTQDVWITANNSDRVLRFTPATRTFVSYPSPVRVTVLRDLVFTQDGRVCASQSNLPAYGIEDGVPSFICIDPEGGDKDRAALAAAGTAPAAKAASAAAAKGAS